MSRAAPPARNAPHSRRLRLRAFSLDQPSLARAPRIRSPDSRRIKAPSRFSSTASRRARKISTSARMAPAAIGSRTAPPKSQAADGTKTSVTGTLELRADGTPVRYEWSTQGAKKAGATVTFNGPVATIELHVPGARPFTQQLTFSSPLIVILDNNLYYQYGVLAHIYDWDKKGPQTFSVLVPQEHTPGTITVAFARQPGRRRQKARRAQRENRRPRSRRLPRRPAHRPHRSPQRQRRNRPPIIRVIVAVLSVGAGFKPARPWPSV